MLSLCENQSGWNSVNKLMWDRSWKLLEQAAESNLMVTEYDKFYWGNFDGYIPMGHRGHGGHFLTGDAELFIMHKSNANSNVKRSALQSPMYIHEIHLITNINHRSIDFQKFELQVKQAIISILSQRHADDVVWSVNIVDMYICPHLNEVILTIQIAYASLNKVIRREEADSCRLVLERELPLTLGMK